MAPRGRRVPRLRRPPKVRDVVGLYLNPPERNRGLVRDERSQIQALDRIAPILPMLPGTPQRATHDYRRAGTSSLYAALDISTGKVIGALHQRHRSIELKKFLQAIDREVHQHVGVAACRRQRRRGRPPRSRRVGGASSSRTRLGASSGAVSM